VGSDVPVDSEVFLMTDFINLKIKSVQFFRDAHMIRMYVHMFIGVSVYTCINIYVYIMFLKKLKITNESKHLHAGSVLD
jgi:hypothetical protein